MVGFGVENFARGIGLDHDLQRATRVIRIASLTTVGKAGRVPAALIGPSRHPVAVVNGRNVRAQWRIDHLRMNTERSTGGGSAGGENLNAAGIGAGVGCAKTQIELQHDTATVLQHGHVRLGLIACDRCVDDQFHAEFAGTTPKPSAPMAALWWACDQYIVWLHSPAQDLARWEKSSAPRPPPASRACWRHRGPGCWPIRP